MADLIPFDFDGLDESLFVMHPKHGVCVHSDKFIRWAGWSTPSNARRDHLLPGMEVEISISIRRGRGTTKSDVKHLTKRGIRRLLMRSNHPRAEQYSEIVLDMLDELDRTGMVVDVWESDELYQRLKAAAETADEYVRKEQGGAMVLNTGLAASIARQWFEEQKAAEL